MEKLLCSCCGAAIIPTVTEAFLTCEYCDSSVPNPYYDKEAAAEAAQPSLEETCISALLEMGAAQNLARLDPECFGSPINGIDTARAGLSISDAHQVYFLYAHTFLFLAFTDGLALTDGGLYYKCDDSAGSLSWEAFITGAISCVDRIDDQDGTLKIGSTIELPVKSDKDSRLARFLVDFHNHVYRQHTGETAPAAWAVTEPAAILHEAVQPAADNPTLLDAVLPVMGALLTGSAARRQTIAKRAPAMHPTSRPTAHKDRKDHIQMPRPLHSQPHHRPAAPLGKPAVTGKPGMPGIQSRPASPKRPGGMSGPQSRPGNPQRPGGMPGGQRRPGGPGKGRR